MANPQKRKGDAFERDIVRYFRDAGYDVDRTRAGWSDDRGDIHGIKGPSGTFTIECKNHRKMDLPTWFRELDAESRNNGGTLGAVIHKRIGVSEAEEQYVSFPLRMLLQLLREAGYK